MEVIMLTLLCVNNVRLEDILSAFNKFTHKAGDSTLLWVSEDSVGGRRVEIRGTYEDAVLDWAPEGDTAGFGYCLGYDPRLVTEVEFVSATSGSVLRWTRNGFHHLERAQDTDFGDFEYRQGREGYEGAYLRAFNEAVNS